MTHAHRPLAMVISVPCSLSTLEGFARTFFSVSMPNHRPSDDHRMASPGGLPYQGKSCVTYPGHPAVLQRFARVESPRPPCPPGCTLHIHWSRCLFPMMMPALPRSPSDLFFWVSMRSECGSKHHNVLQYGSLVR